MAIQNSHFSLFTSNDDRVCGNCAHWLEERGIPLRHGVTYAPCALEGRGVEDALEDARKLSSLLRDLALYMEAVDELPMEGKSLRGGNWSAHF